MNLKQDLLKNDPIITKINSLEKKAKKLNINVIDNLCTPTSFDTQKEIEDLEICLKYADEHKVFQK